MNDSGAILSTRTVHIDGSLGALNLISDLEFGRGTGYPIMSRFNESLFFTWTNPAKPSLIESRWIKLNDLLF